MPDLESIRPASPTVVTSSRVAGSRTRETIRLGVALSRDVGDREIERTRQLPAGPIQGIEPRTAAAVLTALLLDHYFGI